MHTITGGIQFKKGGEIPQKMKDHIAKNGFRLPFSATGFKYANTKLDSWLVIKDRETGKKMQFDRAGNKFCEVKTQTVINE